MTTLRKLKRTMSLSKAPDKDPLGSAPDQASRRSSRSSTESDFDLGEDAGVTRRIAGHPGCTGRLKLSFILTKGQLEVDVICAQDLNIDPNSSSGVYVKLYLRGRNKGIKKKTRVVQPSGRSIVFKQLIKYDGSLVDDRLVEVSAWQNQGGLKGKLPIGFTEIRLAELRLDQLQTSWYKLRPMDAISSSSVED